MQIALVASLVSPIRSAEANGPHAVIGDLARGLRARGHDAAVYAAAGSKLDGVPLREIDVEAEAADAAIRIGTTAPVGAMAALARV